MANIASAKKRARQNKVRRFRNSAYRSMLRTFMKKVNIAILEENKDAANDAYKTLVPIIDRTANKGLIHKNKAARHKRILQARLRLM